MSVQILFECNVKPESAANMSAHMRDNLGDTRAFDGCEGLTVQSNVEDSNNLVLVEQWASREHYEKYLAWRRETGDLETIMSMLADEPSIRYFDLVDV